jgi:hypothetical protein
MARSRGLGDVYKRQGQYRVDFAAADLNGNVVTLKATATGCDDLFMTLILEP